MKFLIIDVESAGLYGDGFAIAYVLINRDGLRLKEGVFFTQIEYAKGLCRNLQWVKEYVKLDFDRFNNAEISRLPSIHDVRNQFWSLWCELKNKYPDIYLAGDCIFPVEANFLRDCVMIDDSSRQWNAPYPIIEISTLLLACGKDPKGKYQREDDELPEHNSLCDARQSARIMIECFNQLNIFKENES